MGLVHLVHKMADLVCNNFRRSLLTVSRKASKRCASRSTASLLVFGSRIGLDEPLSHVGVNPRR